MPPLFAACMRVVTGMRSASLKPRRRMMLKLARQLWQPVSAIADSSVDLGVFVTGLYPRAT